MEDGKSEYVNTEYNVTNVNTEKPLSKRKEVPMQSGLHAY